MTAQNPGRNPGRNDPCHCGSGKKYKKCCMLADEFRKKNGSKELNEDLELGEKLVKEYDDSLLTVPLKFNQTYKP